MGSLDVIKDGVKNISTGVGQIIAVAAGKGGVGKSTVAVNLALALKKMGQKVGILDADVYGPSLEQMLPEGMEPVDDEADPEKLIPALSLGIPFISVAHFKREASIVRAPIANSLIDQFLTRVDWGELDTLLIDFPPGTGDIQLTLMQKAAIAGALVVTTPQAVATLDVRKAIQLFQRMEIPILGVVENMSYLPTNGDPLFPFGKGGGEGLAEEFFLPFLGKIPIDSSISRAGDNSVSLFDLAPEEPGAVAFGQIAQGVLDEMGSLESVEHTLRLVDPSHLELKIGEGEWKRLSVFKIQKNCPCARCTPQRESGAEKLDSNVSLLEFSPVGRYAYRFVFTTGCKQGIYSISLLSKLA